MVADGRKIVFISGPCDSMVCPEQSDLYVVNSNETRRQRLTRPPSRATALSLVLFSAFVGLIAGFVLWAVGALGDVDMQ